MSESLEMVWISQGGAAAFPMALEVALKGTGFLLAAGAIALALRRASAAARHFAWTLALGGLLCLPLLSLAIPRWPVPVLPYGFLGAEGTAGSGGDAGARGLPTVAVVAPAAGEAGLRAPEPPFPHEGAGAAQLSRESSRGPLPGALWTFAIWIGGTLACLARLLVGSIAARRYAREARDAGAAIRENARELSRKLGLQRRVRVLLSDRVTIPATWGCLRAIVFLPSDFPAWSEARRRAALLHELAHVRRRDCATQLLSQFAVAVHWFNPLAWLAARFLRKESERACDDLVLNAGSPPGDYASCLLEIATSLTTSAPPPAAAVAMARSSQLRERLLAILDSERRREEVGRPARFLGHALVLGALVSLAGARLTCRESEGGDDLEADAVITVAPSGRAMYRSIREAIEAAPEGALVRVAPGTYDERFTISRPLTVEGSGWERTVLTSECRAPERELTAEVIERIRGAETDEERRAIQSAFLQEHGPKPTVLVRGAGGVVIRGLKITLRSARHPDRIPWGAALVFGDARATISRCAVVGSPANGIVISGGSEVEIRECLIAGAWSAGIVVGRPQAGSGRASISGCEVRNCRHRGIVVKPGNTRATVIEGSRISGSAWHGIRYDNASPQVIGNSIFSNERFGIYASGKTAARVRGNLFHGNGMAGMSCWFHNGDTIEKNTFAANRRSGLEVLGASRPRVSRNIFYSSPKGVLCANIAADSPAARSDGRVSLDGNIFWQTEHDALWQRPVADGDESTEEPIALDRGGNRRADPLFAAAERGDFSLSLDSLARFAGIGAAESLSMESAWPLQTEESAVLDDRDEREASEAPR